MAILITKKQFTTKSNNINNLHSLAGKNSLFTTFKNCNIKLHVCSNHWMQTLTKILNTMCVDKKTFLLQPSTS